MRRSLPSLADKYCLYAASATLKRTLIVTAIPFAIYLFSLYELGDYLSNALGVETGSRTFGEPNNEPSMPNPRLTAPSGLFSTTLDRICVPGVVLIAALSGGGAVNTAWEAFEWRERFKRQVQSTLAAPLEIWLRSSSAP